MTGPADRYRALAQRTLRANAPLLYTERATWSDGLTRRFSLGDPNQEGGKGFTRLQTDPIPASLRLLRLYPGDPEPEPGTHAPYQGGSLVFGLWGDESAWTGQRVGVCRLVDERAYPQVATIGTQGFRLRITALDAPALSVSGGNDLQASANNSHRGHLPPGVHLHPGEEITTADGDRYLVVPPVQRDSLGDVVGLSWQGSGAPQTQPPAEDVSAPDPAPTPTTGDDSWWKERP
ncbi:hypothetical protein QOL99_00185 [Deinococcus sp. MIMF12]|uniref:Uncharacterized protein n=1 Tax=Deinococcus rhizophilus TaxID=3049544 RepID=A0ABT7JC78_9DEIO|nr:hypothetical protein [Deinococcus rhizophilus]MDL2342566.1 hypothetical protein [Deinococcus rhizophilus]